MDIIGQYSPFAKKIGDKVCPDLGPILLPSETTGLANLQFFKCLEDKCKQWDYKNKRCGKIVAEKGGSDGQSG